MKVLLISQITVVDYKYTYSLANALVDKGIDVELVIDDKNDNEYCRCKYYNKFLTSRKDIGKIRKLINYVQSFFFILKKIREEDYDIVHFQWIQVSPIDYFFMKVIKRKGVKLVASVHDILPFNEKKYDFYFHKKIYELCDNIIVQAKINIDRFANLFPGEANKVTYVPHGHFLDFTDVYEKKKAREHLYVPKDKMVLLFFGQIKKVKGLGILLQAFGELAATEKDIFLIVAGSVWKDDFSVYDEIIKKYKLDETQLKLDIRFVPDEEIGYYYSACDIAVLPYTDVYQSGVIQLVYAYKKPVIATKLASFCEIVEDGKSGFLCEPNDVNELKNAIIRAKEKQSEFEGMGERGYRIVEEKFAWNDIADKIVGIYES